VKVGAEIAQLLLASRGRRAQRHRDLRAGSGPFVWVPTPPGFPPVTAALLARVTPFTMESPSQFVRPDRRLAIER